MALDVVGAALEVTEPLREVGGEQLLDQVLRMPVKVPREFQLPLENLLVDAERVFVVKGRVAREHLVAEHTKRPPVHGLAVPLRENDLWREVLWRAAERPRAVLHL